MSVVKVLRHGQITLPKSLREVLDIKEGDILEIELERSHLILRTKILIDKEKSALEPAGLSPFPVYQEMPEFTRPKNSVRGQGRGGAR
jgi:AbrB family looped-hinge helix DNA binding protein